MSLTHCYMCDAKPTSVEHVPPRCFFPQKKDLPNGVDLRKQLITVPSCDVHNTEKSMDDVYLLYAVSMNIPNNLTASDHFTKKIMRSINRNPSVIKRFTEKHIPVKVEDTESGEIHETLALKVDLQRIKNTLEMIGRALYFHHFKSSWKGNVSAYPDFILALTEPNSRAINEPLERMFAYAEELFKHEKHYGENQEVFLYQVATGPLQEEPIMLLQFYKGSRVTILFHKIAS